MKFLIALFASTLPLLAQSPWDVSLAQPTVSALSYSNIIWDKFLTAEASPIVGTNRAAEPGPGYLSAVQNGPDEAVFLENGDNGATYMNDDVHPNHGGYMLTAKKWRETLGL
jgi:hypothetical protein